jgi:glycosyltransferase involved in cell wall biosynthesis
VNILFLTQVLPYPPDSGPKIKTWNVLRFLAQKHDITLVSFVRGDQQEDEAQLARYCRAVYTVPIERTILNDGRAVLYSLVSGIPWMMARDDRRAMRRLVERVAADTAFDIVHADQLNMAQYAARLNAPKVLDEHNALWLLYRRLASRIKPGVRRWMLERDWRLLKRYEGRIVREFDAVLAVSDEDRAALQEATGVARPITVIPIAIDTDQVSVVERRAGANHLLHMGTMYWPPNIDGVTWFIEEIYPLIRRHRPDVVLDVVGSRPPPHLVRLGEQDAGICVPGYVADPTPYLEQAAAFLVPLRAGGGMRVKILNALAQGLPIVSTTLGAEGIAVTPGKNILLADTPKEFADAVLRLLHDPALAGRLGAAGRRLAEEQYDYRVTCSPLEDVYVTLHGERGKTGRGVALAIAGSGYRGGRDVDCTCTCSNQSGGRRN